MTVKEYINAIPEDRKEYFIRLRKTIKDNLPAGFRETMNYGMLGYVVPHSLYPKGYHCKPEDPLPFIGLAVQKGPITLYHMGLYANPELMTWFRDEYAKTAKHKLDMGKSCIRFKYYDEIPYELIGDLAKKISPKQWIEEYEKRLSKPGTLP